MTSIQVVAALNRWLFAPIPNASGRLGLFRVVYASFYLWHLSFANAGLFAQAPEDMWHPQFLYRYLLGRPPEWLPGITESLLVGLLVLLLIGYKTRLVTVLIFVLGGWLDGFLQSFGKVEHATIFLTVYIPLLMSISRWGDTYSADRAVRLKAGESVPGNHDVGWEFCWPNRAIMALLSILFLTAALSKVIGGTWAANDLTIPHLVLDALWDTAGGAPQLIPGAEILIDYGWMAEVLRWFIPVFEGFFFLVLIGGRTERIYVSAVLVFHAFNALFLGVTFTPVLIAYGLSVDWQNVAAHASRRGGIPGLRIYIASRVGLTVALVVAAFVAVDWNTTGLSRFVIGLGGLLNWQTIWFLVGPLAAIRCVHALVEPPAKGSRSS